MKKLQLQMRNVDGDTCIAEVSLDSITCYEIAMTTWSCAQKNRRLNCMSWRVPISVFKETEDGSVTEQRVTSYRCDSYIFPRHIELLFALYLEGCNLVYKGAEVVHIAIDNQGFVVDSEKEIYVQGLLS